MHTVCMYVDKNFYGKKVSKHRENFTMINRLDFIKILGSVATLPIFCKLIPEKVPIYINS
jgi:hypothetical protein